MDLWKYRNKEWTKNTIRLLYYGAIVEKRQSDYPTSVACSIGIRWSSCLPFPPFHSVIIFLCVFIPALFQYFYKSIPTWKMFYGTSSVMTLRNLSAGRKGCFKTCGWKSCYKIVIGMCNPCNSLWSVLHPFHSGYQWYSSWCHSKEC